jgi:hypothetical protein
MKIVPLLLLSVLSLRALELNVPETSAVIEVKMPKVLYTNGLEKGSVFVDFFRMQKVENGFVVPFVVSNQGSGVFYYIALLNAKKEHKKSYFIGDRVKIKDILIKNSKVYVIFLSQEGLEDTKVFSSRI